MKKTGWANGLRIAAAISLIFGIGADAASAGNGRSRVIGGDPVEAQSQPAVAALVETGQDPYFGHFGSGLLIDPQWVLTAAGNVFDEDGDIKDPEDLEIVLGAVDLLQDDTERIAVSRIVVHPEYDPATNNADAALLELATPSVQPPALLYPGDADLAGSTATVLGWGISDFDNFPSVLQGADITVVDDDTLKGVYGDSITDTMMGAGETEGGKGPCDYDAGGPLLVNGDVAGIISWWEGCAEAGKYGVYTRISAIRDFVGTYVPVTYRSIRFPHIAAEGNWETVVTVINTGDDPITGRFRPLDDSGSLVSEVKAVSLAPHARQSCTVSQDFADAGAIRYMTFDTLGTNVAAYAVFSMDGIYRAAVEAGPDASDGDIFIPAIEADTDEWTSIALINTADEDKTVTLEFDTGETESMELAAGAHVAFTVKSLFHGVARPDIASAVIRNGEGLVGLSFISGSSMDGEQYLAGMSIGSETDTSLFYPHLISDDVWETFISVLNPSSFAANVNLTPFALDGSPLPTQDIAIGPGERYMAAASGIAALENAAWMRIDASEAVTGIQMFRTLDSSMAGSCTALHIDNRSGIFPKNATESTGIAFVNTSDQNALVNLTAYGADGAALAQIILQVSAYAKEVGTAESFFRSDVSEAAYIQYSSDQNVAGIVLNAALDAPVLDGLAGL